MNGTRGTVKEIKNKCRNLVGKPKRERTLGRPSCVWEKNVKMNRKIIGYKDGNWKCLAHNTVQGTGFCECDDESLGFVQGREFLDLVCCL